MEKCKKQQVKKAFETCWKNKNSIFNRKRPLKISVGNMKNSISNRKGSLKISVGNMKSAITNRKRLPQIPVGKIKRININRSRQLIPVGNLKSAKSTG